MFSLLWTTHWFCWRYVHHVFKHWLYFNRNNMWLLEDAAVGVWGAAHLPADGVPDSSAPPLGEAALPSTSPLTEAVIMVLSCSPSVAVAVAGLMEIVAELVSSSPEETRSRGDLWGSGVGVQSEGGTTVCQSLETGERVCEPPCSWSFSSSAASRACGEGETY